MTRAAGIVRDPWQWLRSGYEAWAASPSWTLTMRYGGTESVVAVVRPGVQWVNTHITGQHEVLVRGDTAYVRGPWNVQALAGWTTDPEKAERVLGRRWVSTTTSPSSTPPPPTGEDVLPLPELLTLLGRTPRRSPRRRRPATLEILPPDEPGDGWCLRSDDLARALGVDSGHDAEALALQEVARRRPDLVHLVEGGSHDTVFSAYVPDEETARTIAALLRVTTAEN